MQKFVGNLLAEELIGAKVDGGLVQAVLLRGYDDKQMAQQLEHVLDGAVRDGRRAGNGGARGQGRARDRAARASGEQGHYRRRASLLRLRRVLVFHFTIHNSETSSCRLWSYYNTL